MDNIIELKKQLQKIKSQGNEGRQIKQLKKQIKAEKFAQTKQGKMFNKIADIGDAGLKATMKFLSQPNPVKKSGIKSVVSGEKKQ